VQFSDRATSQRAGGPGDDADSDDKGEMREDEYTPKLMDTVDYPLLLIFTGQFIQIQGLVGTGMPKCMWDAIIGWDDDHMPLGSLSDAFLLTVVVVILSNAISNVPLVLLMKPMLADVAQQFGQVRFATCTPQPSEISSERLFEPRRCSYSMPRSRS
jgi:hypothetical protein